MSLYLLQCDGDSRYFEAESFAAAVAIWRCAYVSDEPVVRGPSLALCTCGAVRLNRAHLNGCPVIGWETRAAEAAAKEGA